MSDIWGEVPKSKRAKPERDGIGRYRIPDPETGEMLSRTRATTISGGIADKTGLEKWKLRMVAWGIGQREDLYAQLASLSGPHETKALDDAVRSAEESSGANKGRNLGDAYHRFTEHIDDGEKVNVPERWRADIDAYCNEMAKYGIGVDPRGTECVLLNTAIDVAGTCDRWLYREDWGGLLRIGDLKTGKQVELCMDEIAAQLAIYANASLCWNPATKTFTPIPENIDKEVAIVMHVPVGRAKCTLYEVDIAAGWLAVLREMEQRAHRKRKDLHRPLSIWEAPKAEKVPSFDDVEAALLWDRIGWVEKRARAVVAGGDEPREMLVHWWKEACSDIPIFRRGGPTTHDHVDRVAGLCNLIETVHGLSGFDEDPDPARRAKDTTRCPHGIPRTEDCPTCLRLPKGWTPKPGARRITTINTKGQI